MQGDSLSLQSRMEVLFQEDHLILYSYRSMYYCINETHKLSCICLLSPKVVSMYENSLSLTECFSMIGYK